jgi:hypothetical protein
MSDKKPLRLSVLDLAPIPQGATALKNWAINATGWLNITT